MTTLNPCYTKPTIINPIGIMVHSIGINQPNREVLINNFNRPDIKVAVHAFADDTGVTQCLPYNYLAWHCGGKANRTHIAIEMCEPKTLYYDKNGQVRMYVHDDNYVNAVLRNTAAWCAARCAEMNIPITSITTHRDGARNGLASNHVDPYHLWDFYNYTISDFRIEVKKIMNELKRYNTISEMPEWCRKDIQNLINKEIIKGTDNGLDLSLDMIRVLIMCSRMVK